MLMREVEHLFGRVIFIGSFELDFNEKNVSFFKKPLSNSVIKSLQEAATWCLFDNIDDIFTLHHITIIIITNKLKI